MITYEDLLIRKAMETPAQTWQQLRVDRAFIRKGRQLPIRLVIQRAIFMQLEVELERFGILNELKLSPQDGYTYPKEWGCK